MVDMLLLMTTFAVPRDISVVFGAIVIDTLIVADVSLVTVAS